MKTTTDQPSFCIGNIPIYGDIVHAPMDGFTDSPFRIIARQYGSAITYTEFINAIDVLTNPVSIQNKIRFTDAERPIAFQLFDNDPERIRKAALILCEHRPDILDINLGCSVPRVANRGAGAGLLRDPLAVAKIFNQLSKELNIPITAKIRLGWDDNMKNYLDISRIIEENGGKMIAVHARTKQQGMKGEVDWEAIHQIKVYVRIPVIGNGDIISIQDIEKIKTMTSCDAIMIGRASIGNPWILAKQDILVIPKLKIIETIKRHLEMTVSFYGESRGVIRFRKHLKKYLQQSIIISSGEIRPFLTLKRSDQIIALLNKNY